MSNSRRPLRIVAPYHLNNGYCKMSRAILRAALVAGFDVAAVQSDVRALDCHWTDDDRVTHELLNPKFSDIHPEQEEELQAALRNLIPQDSPTLLIQLAQNLRAWPQYGNGPVAGLTMTESNNLCRDWKHGCLQVDSLIAPSSYCADTFGKVVPDVPCSLVPLAVDDRIWTCEPEDHRDFIPDNAPPFLFVSVFRNSKRKNWEKLILAFAEEFKSERKKVGLIVKPSRVAEVSELADCAQEMGAWVKVDGDKRNDYMLAALYRACDVYVQPSSEGFGLGPVEAALCGLPSVVLSHGGSADVVSEDTGYIVPSAMVPIPGHMPQWYPRPQFDGDPDGHCFADCSIDDLRATLRRAYESETGGAAKGITARIRALQRFTPEAVAPKLSDAIYRAISIHSENVRDAEYPQNPKWATCAGAWGDVFAQVGTIRKMMREKEIERIGVLFYGKDMRIAEWLHEQPWCKEVLPFIQPDQIEMTKVYGRLCQAKPKHGRQAWYDLIRQWGLTGEIAFTQLCLAEQREPQYWHGSILSPEAYAWADSVAPEGDFLVLNPLSIASNTMADHWRYWGPAITWLLNNVKCPVVMVGESPVLSDGEAWPSHPNLIDASGQSKSMQDVLALAERSAGIVTTSNNLGIYATIAGKEAVVVMARTCPKGAFYHTWYEAPRSQTGLVSRSDDEMDVSSNSIVEFLEPFCDFKTAIYERFGHLMKPAEPMHAQEDRDIISETDYYNDHEAALGRAQ